MTRQYPLPLPHNEAMEADDYMVTSSNREAAAWVETWPAWSTHCLVIYGPSGSGKTHLAQVWQKRSHAQALTVGELAEKGMEHALSRGNVIAIDDADGMAGIPAYEENLFHLYNRIKETKGFLLLASSQAPAQWKLDLPDLRSRLTSVPAVAIAAPDDELLSAMLIKQFRDRQISIGTDVVDYLLPRTERTPAAIRKLVTTLDQASLAEGRRITVALARKFLEDQGFLIS